MYFPTSESAQLDDTEVQGPNLVPHFFCSAIAAFLILSLNS